MNTQRRATFSTGTTALRLKPTQANSLEPVCGVSLAAPASLLQLRTGHSLSQRAAASTHAGRDPPQPAAHCQTAGHNSRLCLKPGRYLRAK
eukprot:CAMPEP_0204365526 /NCGR_PEP_ID=MMETSP0469-20131031/41970_1 /ASSEMBLY_ACC=CAM_ASM_000384 /TAXON_ID=2969 /ORGANISM="Oxyrrhis marina" /LENGTH=90 /DNA_ID=CAMNT_0051354593 /DNA_START=25 /DNA_END=297 /DNA_ORIENTATION=+